MTPPVCPCRVACLVARGLFVVWDQSAFILPSLPPSLHLIHYCPLSGPQVLHLYCDTCSVPICRECTIGRHGGHSFVYLQDALQDSRALTIQLLADAQQGRQAIQVSIPFTDSHQKPVLAPTRGQTMMWGAWKSGQKGLLAVWGRWQRCGLTTSQITPTISLRFSIQPLPKSKWTLAFSSQNCRKKTFNTFLDCMHLLQIFLFIDEE
jgi:hypothetical protein